REAAVTRRAGEEAARPFDLSAGPLFRAALLRMDEEDHVLLISMHHIVSDGWSLGVLFGEMSTLYEAYREGRDSPLAELPVQYADYAAWQRAELRGERLDRQLAWWKERLAGGPALLELPADHPRPAVQSYRGALERIALPVELLEGLRRVGRSEGATLYMVLLGAFQVLLGKYCGDDDVVVGTSIAGRTRREVEPLIGFFVNTLALRTDLSGDPGFRRLLRRVREATLGAYEHQDVPFERLVEELQPERSLSQSPLVQVTFDLHEADIPGGGLAGLRDREVEAETRTTKFDLSLDLMVTSRGLAGGLTYSTDLFEAGTIRRMLDHLRRVLEQVAADPDVRLSRIGLAGAEERRRVVEEWNRTEVPFPRDACVHQLFEAQVERAPDALAVAWSGRELTYRDLDTWANRLAHHLAGLGVRPETRVGVLLERGVEMVAATLAVMKAGGCCVPVDTTYPPERMALMLADSSVRVLLSQGDLCAPLAGAGLHIVRLDADADALAAEPDHARRAAVSAGNLAYVFYTSGSTGRPKGVMMGHREVVQLAACIPGTMPMGAGDRVAQASNASFDAAVFEIWGALLHGAALVGVGHDVLLSAPLLARALREGGITHLYQTAALLDQHLRERADVYSSLRQLVFGAEAVGTEGVRLMLRHGRPGRVLHEYGPTEATVWCTLEVVEEVEEGAATVPIGRPVPNARAYVLDAALEPLPPGVPGELYVGGAGVVRGYLGQPGVTAGRFVPDRFAPEPGARMYRTGDRVRWTAGGKLEFMGRLDQQVKVRGFRIEPGEVESAICACPGVRQARVVVREDRPGDKRLVAYVVGEAETGAVRAHLRRSLPEYMVPQAFVALERLPLTPNGKLDRRELPAPGDAAADAEAAPPRTPAEEVLAAIWAEVLGRARVGTRENFFELGGHSLLATRLVSRIRSVFAVELPVRALFEGPTVAEVAARVEALRRAGAPTPAPVLPVARPDTLPLSFGQERLWFLDRLQQGGATYNISEALRLSGGLDEAALERALAEIVRRHESLRTTFREVDGVPSQVIAPFGGFALPMEDLSALREAEREAEARRRAREDAALPFDLTAGPLFRAGLLRLAPGEHLLLLCMHHVVSDGWSMRVFFRELWELYDAYREGRGSPLPELPVQYADYAVWQQRQRGGEVEKEQLGYWRETLAGAPELLELPADHPRPPVPSFRGGTVPVEIPLEVLERLREVGRREGATLYMIVLAGFQALLSRYGGSDDVVVGTPVAGRTRQEVEELIGLFMNTLVLRSDLSGNPSFRALVARVRETVLGAYEHQEVPFERVVAELQPERSLSRSTLFQVMFQLDDAGGPAPASRGLRVRDLGEEREGTKFDLTLVLAAHARGISGALQYSTDLFERGTARRMAEHLERLLEQAAADPDRRLSRLELMGRAERARVVEWNRTTAKYPADRCIHQLFEGQARQSPDAVALLFEGASLTYRELDERANRLARHLVRLGARPEARVGICLERSVELMVAILGVMKAGAAYVPMDPGHPAERLAYVLEDSGVEVLLTQEKLRGRLPVLGGVRVVSVDGERGRVAAESPEALETGVTSENLAYVIYTSGSTGRPKGVAMHHRGVCNYIHWGVRAYGAAQGSGAPVFTSMAVDLTVTNLLPLFAGRPVRLLPEDSPVEALARVLREGPGFGLIKITPVHLGLLNSMLEPGDLPGAAHTLVVGADFLSAEPTVPWQEHAPRVRLMNEYGPTETVVGCSAYVLPPGRHRAGPVPVGRAIQNLAFHVLDAHLEPAPVGLPGELYIGGAGVARGYLGRPGLTAEKFVPDPFADPGTRMYRTGDRARWLADGNLLILGRMDNQVKVRGYRVELGEIEAVLRRRAEVRECIVALREDRPGDRRLVAYVVADPETADPAALRGHLRTTLPEYMVPDAVVVLDALPQTPTGKLDRRALPVPRLPDADPDLDEPRNYEEARLIPIWEELLGVEGVGPTRSFFELGGNSFLALRLFAQVNRALGCDLPVATLFAGATIRQMADAVREQRRSPSAAPASVVPLQPHGSLPPLFVIHSSDRDVMGYVNLVRHLGAGQPVFGVRDVGDDMARPITRIAAEHVAAVRGVQPEGPYYLAGWSFGGFVAYEMAFQLEQAGETVAFVGLLDTMSPVLAQAWPHRGDLDLALTMAEEAAARMRRPFSLAPDEREALEGLDSDEQVRRIVEALHAAEAAPPAFDAAALGEACRTIRDRNQSYAGYVPGCVSATVTLFRATDNPPRHQAFFDVLPEAEKHTLGWSRHAGSPVAVHPVPGTHATVGAEPHARVLVGRMRESLASARERAPGATHGLRA
ncbi:MAG TPA: amino acid adenylation domain-containing protein, partial [Longimicrobium sp.]